MLFNSGFNQYGNQNPYQRLQQLENQMQQYPQQQISSQFNVQATQQSPNQFSYVNGIEGAKAWILSPNSKILLMDSDDDRFYLKETDASGMATIKTYTFSQITENKTRKEKSNDESYLTKKEFQEYKAEIDKFKEEFTELFNPPLRNNKKVIIDG